MKDALAHHDVAMVPDFLTFWGKARADADAEVPWHPAAYHLLDVAAVAEAILAARPMAAQRAGRLLGLPSNQACRLLVTLVALHDLGKFAPAFQAKAPEHWPARIFGPLDRFPVAPGHHTEDGLVLWEHRLARVVVARVWPGGDAALRTLAPAIFGHHGRPVMDSRGRSAPQRYQRREAEAAAMACATAVLELLQPVPISGAGTGEREARRASWWVAGLVTVADWIGSSERWFRPYVAPLSDDPTLARYWELARARAAAAVREAGLDAPNPAGVKSFASLTRLPSAPTPAQRWAETTPLGSGPLLVVLEDVTGAGKTEAAQMVVHRLMAAGRASGAYWAMPTQATANAMYARQADALDALFTDADRRPSLVLAHGQQRLHERFRASVLDGAPRSLETADADPAARGEPDEPPGAAACAAWLADDRRAAMLADVGAGTIDQALLAVLPARFNAVRLFGLADKVLVVDEAHAYDRYMGVELEELLRFHAALGGSAVVLSATLPHARREALARAWQDGLLGGQRRIGTTVALHSKSYPLATVVSDDGVREDPVDTAPWSARSVGVRLVHDEGAALAHVVDAARLGGSVAWVRNTVDDCIAAAALLRAHGVEPLVFHARFAQADRQRREQDVLARFGKHAPDDGRRGRVLVATQVIEQSLDLDFDAMVSDVAPVDLLVQRAGRLRRHVSRDASRPSGTALELVVLSPPPDADPPAGWLGGPFAGTAHVYENAGVLWRTVRTLDRVRAIVTPSGLRDLIESVYGADDTPPALCAATDRAEGKASGHAATATIATLKMPLGYDANQQAWLSELRVPTRLGDPQTTVRLARVRGDGTLSPWAESEDGAPAWKAWALSEVRLSARRVPFGATAEPRHAAAVAAARTSWGRFEQDIALLPLESAGDGVWQGVLHHPDRTRPILVSYTEAEGIAYA